MAPSDRTGILLVRLWIEPGGPDGFRARITCTLNSAKPEQATSTVASPEDVTALVRAWMDAFITANVA